MKDLVTPPQMPLRPTGTVMRLARMGAMFPTRLSFLRTLLRRLARERVEVVRPVWSICAQGYGHAVYTLSLGGHRYSLVAVATALPEAARTDRVIAEAWDTAYVLYDGVPDAGEIARICATAPRQEAARFTERDLVLSRANKSVRLFDHVVGSLRAGRQPDPAEVQKTGYLMRTTAVYGNGKFGIADRAAIAARPGLSGPFMAEMLTVWLIRHFTHDLAEHMGGGTLDPAIKRHLGIGNATGLGMAPFLVTHPVLLNNWMAARETALARVRAVPALEAEQVAQLTALATRAAGHLAEWQVPDTAHQARIDQLRSAWAGVASRITPEMCAAPRPLDRLFRAAATGGPDLEELTVALLLEPFGALVDDLAEGMADPFDPPPEQTTHTDKLRARLETAFAWALGRDYDTPEHCRRFWYVSAAKQEPRLGDRFAEPGAALESPLDVARRVAALHAALPDKRTPVLEFLDAHPEHLFAVERVEMAAAYPYAEIRDNLIAADCLPIDLLRCKLSFFGAAKFDPKSDLWTRITLFQGAPLAEEVATRRDHGWLPVLQA
ncbi:hypothetical protein [uncultured Roseobacter sp.]|uniref:hypothetical protein n=1 Tax=uncultured Roseobacter sp. TaxID=114847 RepID=UPI0026073CF7|nr:hypothetical protein [uncultured Roseobacter sp.]